MVVNDRHCCSMMVANDGCWYWCLLLAMVNHDSFWLWDTSTGGSCRAKRGQAWRTFIEVASKVNLYSASGASFLAKSHLTDASSHTSLHVVGRQHANICAFVPAFFSEKSLPIPERHTYKVKVYLMPKRGKPKDKSSLSATFLLSHQ